MNVKVRRYYLAVRLCYTTTEHIAAYRDLTILSVHDNRLL